jgi:uncharacterized peroxidase-related enzyme
MTNFTVHAPNNAPEKSREILEAWQKRTGFVPNILGIMAESPALLRGYDELYAASERSGFTPAEREVIHMTVSSLNHSPYCIAARTTWGEKAGVPRDVLDALRRDLPLKDARLEALRNFTRAVMKKIGRADEKDLNAFYKAGFSKAQVMDVLLIVSLNTIGNYVSHIAGPQLDRTFEPNRVEDRKSGEKSSCAA